MAYVLLWPRFLDELRVVPVKGDFGSLQVGDIFFILFGFLFVNQLLSRRVQTALLRQKLPILLMVLFVGYWVLQVTVMVLDSSARQTVNQLRSLVYYVYFLFFLARIKDTQDVAFVLKVFLLLGIPAFLLQSGFLAAHSNSGLKLFLFRNTPVFYDECYRQKRFLFTNIKPFVIFFPFLINLVFLKVPEVGLSKAFRLLSLICICLLSIFAQSRAMWLILTVGTFAAFLLDLAKGRVKFRMLAKLVPLGVLCVLAITLLLGVAGALAPGLVEKARQRADSLAMENVEHYEKSRSLGSLNSRLESYRLVFARLQDDYVFGKGLGSVIDRYGFFRLLVDSSYLMVLWAGGIIALTLFLLYQCYFLIQSTGGYLRAVSEFETYFFASSVVSLICTYVMAMQDNVLYSGNSVIAFALLLAMICVMRRSQQKKADSAKLPCG